MGKTAKPRKRTHSSERKKGTTEQEDMNGTASCSGSAAGASATTPGRLVQSGLVDLDPELVYFTHSKIRWLIYAIMLFSTISIFAVNIS
jgi:hypothetical protein